MDPELVTAVFEVMKWIYREFGLLGFLVPPALAILYFVYREWRTGRDVNAVVEEKEKRIQHLAGEVRELKLILYREVLKYSEEQVERLIVKNDPVNGAESRRMLEGPDPQRPGQQRGVGSKKAPMTRRK